MDQVVEMLDYRSQRNESLADAGATVVTFDDDESTQHIGSICPHCKREPAVMTMRPIQFGVFPAAEFSCSGCRKVISVSLMPIPPQMPMQQENPSSLILPRM